MANDVFFVDVSESFSCKNEMVWLAYAPLNGSAFLLNRSEKEILQKQCQQAMDGVNIDTPEVRALLRTPNRPIMQIPTSWNDVYEIDILLNFKCNFKCVYCYSAAGRSDVELKWEKVEPLLDYLFSPQHEAKQTYRINFSGGGEPVLSFDLVKRIVNAIETRAEKSGHQFALSMVTNGSLLTPETMDYLEQHNIRLVLSFEILKRYQDMERGQYEVVAQTLDALLQRKINFGVRATLTLNSASAMPEMVEEIHVRWPRLKSVVFDTVLAPNLFKTPMELKAYYDVFQDSFIKAYELGKKYGISVCGPFTQFLSFQRERTCLGKIVLTPVGRFSACSRISSPKEKLFDSFVYGDVKEDGCIHIDSEQFSHIMNKNTIESRAECQTCFARWNCGGGCRLFSLSFAESYMPVFCDFQKRGLIYRIIQKMESEFFKTTGRFLKEHVQMMVEN